MSEKRFERWNDYSCKVKDNQEGILLNWEDVVQKLNKQQDIIGEQKIAIDELITDYKKLEKENEQLIEENEQLRKQVKSSETTSDATSNYNAHLESKITTLEKENEQLKKEYKIAINEMVTDYKKLEKENEQLREALKNSYNWEICEN